MPRHYYSGRDNKDREAVNALDGGLNETFGLPRYERPAGSPPQSALAGNDDRSARGPLESSGPSFLAEEEPNNVHAASGDGAHVHYVYGSCPAEHHNEPGDVNPAMADDRYKEILDKIKQLQKARTATNDKVQRHGPYKREVGVAVTNLNLATEALDIAIRDYNEVHGHKNDRDSGFRSRGWFTRLCLHGVAGNINVAVALNNLAADLNQDAEHQDAALGSYALKHVLGDRLRSFPLHQNCTDFAREIVNTPWSLYRDLPEPRGPPEHWNQVSQTDAQPASSGGAGEAGYRPNTVYPPCTGICYSATCTHRDWRDSPRPWSPLSQGAVEPGMDEDPIPGCRRMFREYMFSNGNNNNNEHVYPSMRPMPPPSRQSHHHDPGNDHP